MFAGATTIVLSVVDFPNGGGGFTGRTAAGDLSGTLPVRRPGFADGRHGVLPLRRRRLARSCSCSRCVHVAGKARASVGRDPRERAFGDRDWSQHHPLQAVGVRARVVHDRRGGLPARGSGRCAARDQLPDPGLDHPGCNGAHRRHLQPLGRGHRRRVQPAPALRLPGSVGRQPELPAHHLRGRAHPGAAHCPRRARGPGPEGPREAGPAAGATRSGGPAPRREGSS